MFEMIIFVLAIATIFSWIGLFAVFRDAALDAKFKVPEDSVLKRHFLTQLKNEIEDSNNWALRRRYQKLIAAELNHN